MGTIVLLLQIPIAMIGSLVGERQARRDAAITDVSGKWGGSQTIVGPALVVPELERPLAAASPAGGVLDLVGWRDGTDPYEVAAGLLPARGRIARIFCRVGEQVAEGAELIEFEVSGKETAP